MPDLIQCLKGQDSSFQRIVAHLWGIEVDLSDARQGLGSMVAAMREPLKISEALESIPEEAIIALNFLLQNNGRFPWSQFVRRFGEVREMGAGRRDRERPFENPVSPTEALWYRALVGRTFFDTGRGMEEYAYIPEDLIPLIPATMVNTKTEIGRPANPQELHTTRAASDRILDHACTLLAALRLGVQLDAIHLEFDSEVSNPPTNNTVRLTPQVIKQLLAAADLLDEQDVPLPEPTRTFLEAPRGEALALLANAWLSSKTFNELRLLPGLRFEGEWTNDPLQARQAVLDFVSTLPADTWWSLEAFVDDIHRYFPDFQRPAGDYDSWFIRQEGSGEYLRGYENWDEVDGALVRYIITGPMHWLGIVDLASSKSNSPALFCWPDAFKLSRWSPALLEGTSPAGLPQEDGLIQISSRGFLSVARLAPRAIRYQIARFCAWDGVRKDVYVYSITPASLQRAANQGLKTGQLLTLLRRTISVLPPNLVQALERWEKQGTQARLESMMVLRLPSHEVLEALRASSIARFLGDPLGPTAIAVKPGAIEKVAASLVEMGYLIDVKSGEGEE